MARLSAGAASTIIYVIARLAEPRLRIAIAIHNIPEGLAAAAPIYAATCSGQLPVGPL